MRCGRASNGEPAAIAPRATAQDAETKDYDDPTMEVTMSLITILIILLVLFLIGAFPTWPHSRNWGYYPSGGVAIILVVIAVLLLAGRV
jgi:Protein of unknown function (DUF3309)